MLVVDESLSLTINIVLLFGEISLIIQVYVLTVFYHIVTYHRF